MATPDKLIPHILYFEGGMAGNVDGMICTNSGITLATFRSYYGKNKNCNDLRNMTREQWMHIFKTGFWDKWQADSIKSQSIANLLVDWLWGSGKYGITYPQQVLGVKVDGIVGPKTLAAINNYPDQKELFQKLWNRRKKHFEDIAKSPSKKKFLKGWLRRNDNLKWIDDDINQSA